MKRIPLAWLFFIFFIIVCCKACASADTYKAKERQEPQQDGTMIKSRNEAVGHRPFRRDRGLVYIGRVENEEGAINLLQKARGVSSSKGAHPAQPHNGKSGAKPLLLRSASTALRNMIIMLLVYASFLV